MAPVPTFGIVGGGASGGVDAFGSIKVILPYNPRDFRGISRRRCFVVFQNSSIIIFFFFISTTYARSGGAVDFLNNALNTTKNRGRFLCDFYRRVFSGFRHS